MLLLGDFIITSSFVSLYLRSKWSLSKRAVGFFTSKVNEFGLFIDNYSIKLWTALYWSPFSISFSFFHRFWFILFLILLNCSFSSALNSTLNSRCYPDSKFSNIFISFSYLFNISTLYYGYSRWKIWLNRSNYEIGIVHLYISVTNKVWYI